MKQLRGLSQVSLLRLANIRFIVVYTDKLYIFIYK